MIREFLLLAKNFNDFKGSLHIGGWYASEKLDGQRAFWDGGVTRGRLCSEVPWANVEKDARLKTVQVSTGLWSRYGKVIHAPDWWLNELPNVLLDGELWAGRGQYQLTRDIVAHHHEDTGWDQIKFMVFDSPHYSRVFQDGTINNTNFRKVISFVHCVRFMDRLPICSGADSVFESRLLGLKIKITENSVVKIHEHIKLPLSGEHAQERLEDYLDTIVHEGGEGVILRDPLAVWEPKRIKGCLKLKPFLDSEATVVGYVWGRETDKGSKLLGMMGAMIVNWNDIEFELSGFNDSEREMTAKSELEKTSQECVINAGQKVQGWTNKKFPIGSTVTFKYRELTDDGIPKEARFWRKA